MVIPPNYYATLLLGAIVEPLKWRMLWLGVKLMQSARMRQRHAYRSTV